MLRSACILLIPLLASAGLASDDLVGKMIAQHAEAVTNKPALLRAARPEGWYQDDGSELSHFLTKIAGPVMAGSVVWMACGDEQDQRAGRRTVDAVSATAAATELLKYVSRKPRPSGPESQDGFPSGHSSCTTAWAVSVGKAYPDWKWPAYSFAALVGWSRVETQRHTPVQVVAGMALGGWLANRSWASDEGLLGGTIVKHQSPGFAPRPTRPQESGRWTLWERQW